MVEPYQQIEPQNQLFEIAVSHQRTSFSYNQNYEEYSTYQVENHWVTLQRRIYDSKY